MLLQLLTRISNRIHFTVHARTTSGVVSAIGFSASGMVAFYIDSRGMFVNDLLAFTLGTLRLNDGLVDVELPAQCSISVASAARPPPANHNFFAIALTWSIESLASSALTLPPGDAVCTLPKRPPSVSSAVKLRPGLFLQRGCAKRRVQRLPRFCGPASMREVCASHNVHTGSACGVSKAYEDLCELPLLAKRH